MAAPGAITNLWTNFKNLVKKVTYDKTEIENKLSTKANNSLVSQSINGLMSSTDKTKLDGIATGANKTIVDSALSATSTNPVQNKVINSEITSLNNSLANHTHNSLKNYSLGSDVDLNDYKTEGIYIISWTNAQTILNGPPGKMGGRLEVVSVQNGVRQIFHNYGHYDNGLKVYFRNYFASNDEWFDWHTLADDSQITSLNSTITNKADKNHTHGVAKKVTTIAENRYCVQLGNIAIFSWWSGAINNPVRNNWTNLYTLPVKNKGKCVWSCNVLNQRNGTLYFKIDENSNIVQYFFDSSADAPYTPGQLVFFIE